MLLFHWEHTYMYCLLTVCMEELSFIFCLQCKWWKRNLVKDKVVFMLRRQKRKRRYCFTHSCFSPVFITCGEKGPSAHLMWDFGPGTILDAVKKNRPVAHSHVVVLTMLLQLRQTNSKPIHILFLIYLSNHSYWSFGTCTFTLSCCAWTRAIYSHPIQNLCLDAASHFLLFWKRSFVQFM